MKKHLVSAGVAGALIVGSTAVLAATGATETKVVDRLSGSETPAVEVSGPQQAVQIPTGPVKNRHVIDLGNGSTRTRTQYMDGSVHDRDCTAAGVCTDSVTEPMPDPDHSFFESNWMGVIGVAAVVGVVVASDSSESD